MIWSQKKSLKIAQKHFKSIIFPPRFFAITGVGWVRPNLENSRFFFFEPFPNHPFLFWFLPATFDSSSCLTLDFLLLCSIHCKNCSALQIMNQRKILLIALLQFATSFHLNLSEYVALAVTSLLRFRFIIYSMPKC